MNERGSIYEKSASKGSDQAGWLGLQRLQSATKRFPQEHSPAVPRTFLWGLSGHIFSLMHTISQSQPGTSIQCVYPYAEGAGATSKLEGPEHVVCIDSCLRAALPRGTQACMSDPGMSEHHYQCLQLGTLHAACWQKPAYHARGAP